MMQIRKTVGLILFSIFFILLNTAPSHSQSTVTKSGTTSAAFLEVGIGARAMGMGGAYVALANDVSALYWNPAGIAEMQSSSVLFEHKEWLAEINFDVAAIAVSLGDLGSIGAMISVLNMDDLAERTIDQPEGTGNFFSVGDIALGLTYSTKLTDRFSFGITAKYIHQKISQMKADGFAFDFGTQFDTGLWGVQFGAAFTNFGTDMRLGGKDALILVDIDKEKFGNNERVEGQLKTDAWPLPLTFQAGIAKKVLANNHSKLLIVSDFIHPTNNTESINLGFEYSAKNSLFLRGGYRGLLLEDTEGGLSLGAGLVTRFLGNVKMNIDFAYTDFGRLQNVQQFSLILEF